MDNVQDKLNDKHNAAYECVRLLIELVKSINWNDGKQRVAAVIDDYVGGEVGYGIELIDDAIAALKKEQAASEQFMQAIKHSQQGASG